jgi:Tol biopolymer transport system component
MYHVFRKALYAITLVALLVVALPAATSGQKPQPNWDAETTRFLEARIHEPGSFPRHDTSETADVTAIQGLWGWRTEIVDSDGNVGDYPSLVLDDADHPHISYFQDIICDIRYVYHDGTTWQFQIADIYGDSEYTSLVLDSNDRPHISYGGSGLHKLRYAYYDGTAWQTQVVVDNEHLTDYHPLVLDSNNYPSISYYSRDSSTGTYNIKYTRYDGTTWSTELVDENVYGNTAANISMVMDATDHPYITYPGHGGMKYAYHDGATWHIELVSAGVSSANSLALDSAGRPHISYHQDRELKYAQYDGSTWQIQTVCESGVSQISLALDASSLPHISYFDSVVKALKYTHYNGNTWQTKVVRSLASGGRHSLALDTAGHVHIAYHDGSDLVYTVQQNSLESWSKLAFASYRDMNYEIYTAQGDGATPVRRTYNAAADTTPQFNQGATQVAFASTRDGNTEIYKMNADGSNQTRLTWTSDGDYLPAWSPDGSKIAFYSYRDGDAEVYVMDADGSTQTRLTSNPAWDGHPTWSPDGSKIAFVSDRSGSDQLWTMNADGSNQQQLTFGLGTAAYPDWSPDGNRIAFNDDANGDNWLDLAIINSDGTGLTHPLEYSPSLYDYLAPVWAPHGEDLAFAKIQWISYQGNWYWIDAYIHGLDPNNDSTYLLVGSSYDWWPNWQTTDILPPSSQAVSPAWTDTITFTVQWSGADNGLSGLRSYDVQYRDGPDGSWSDWLLDTTQTDAVFTGEYGHTYYFRCRARDYAYNLEAYPDGDGDTFTRVYHYTLIGHVLGNRDQPVAVAAVQTIPPAMNTAHSGAGGNFTLYFDQAGDYALEASRDGFGPLPAMTGVSVGEISASPTLYLPPADDYITDGGFEVGDLSAWHLSGHTIPTITNTVHTGDFAVAFGGLVPSPVVTPTTPFSVSAVITESGGSLDSSQVYVQVPPDAVSNTSFFTLTGIPEITGLPTDTQDLGLHFALEATTSYSQVLTGTLIFTDIRPLTTTLHPVTLILTYEDAALEAAQIAGEESLALWHYDAAALEWFPLSGTLNAPNGTLNTFSNTLTVETEQLGLFALLGKPTESWSSVLEQSVTLSPTLTSGTLSLLYRVAAAESASDTLQVQLIGSTQTVTCSLPLTQTGWVHQWLDVSPWVGSPLTVRVEWRQDKREQLAGVILDEISLGSAVVGSYPVYLPLVMRAAQ